MINFIIKALDSFFAKSLYITQTDSLKMINMAAQVEIDEVDIKILRELVKDARTKLKDIAKKCNLSSTAVLNRMERLKALGVIKGAVLIINMSHMGFMYAASVGVDARIQQEKEILEIMKKKCNLLVANESAGSSNTFRAFVVAKSLKDIENLKQIVRNRFGSRKVTFNLWSNPQFLFENIELEPSKR